MTTELTWPGRSKQWIHEVERATIRELRSDLEDWRAIVGAATREGITVHAFVHRVFGGALYLKWLKMWIVEDLRPPDGGT